MAYPPMATLDDYAATREEFKRSWGVDYPLSLDEYQRLAHLTSLNTKIGGDALAYPVLGLAGEAGEVANKVKKIYRDNGGVLDEDRKLMVAKEIAGVLWYIAEVATVLGLDLSTVAALNLDSLRSRQARGVIGGNGDER